ncbi:uncharacterized protein DDB_G0288805 [Stomoxys calcitrans]|uniref:Uncharacterized protein n=1 Tax=Stomoxys calcitrans TaxID=35570 RepID=A0A1I8Q5T7_STOCA|nr:uncharacterized protein DDB_G0288805 [Stomoxys calcitrans]
MDRGSGRYSFNRREGGGGQRHNNHSNSSLSSSSSSSLSSSSNNHNSYNTHRNTTNNSSHYSNNTLPNNSTTSSSSSSMYTTTTHISNNITSTAREPITQHDELIRYIREAWTKVSEQSTSVRYNDSDNQLKNFKPFNLEEYWGQRLVQNIQISSHGHQ